MSPQQILSLGLLVAGAGIGLATSLGLLRSLWPRKTGETAPAASDLGEWLCEDVADQSMAAFVADDGWMEIERLVAAAIAGSSPLDADLVIEDETVEAREGTDARTSAMAEVRVEIESRLRDYLTAHNIATQGERGRPKGARGLVDLLSVSPVTPKAAAEALDKAVKIANRAIYKGTIGPKAAEAGLASAKEGLALLLESAPT